MATYIIGTPGGYDVEVRAETQEAAIEKARKSWETMPRIIAREGDTRVLERKNGQRYVVSPGFSSTDPKRVEQALSGMAGGEMSRQSIDEAILAENPVTSRLSQFVRGVPFVGSRADELIGVAAGPEAAAGTRALQAAQQRQRPGETIGLNLAGGVTGAAGMAAATPARVAQGIGSTLGSGSRLARVGKGIGAGAAGGAIEGAIYGRGEGTTPEERARNAQMQGLLGAGLGGAFGGAAPIVSDAAQNVIGLFRRSDVDSIAKGLGVSKQAATVIRNAFDMGGSIDDAVAQIRRAGEEGTLADAGVAAAALLDATATSGGRASQIVSDAVQSRAERSGAKLMRELGVDPDLVSNPEVTQRGIRTSTQQARGSAYDAAYSKEIDWRSPAGERLRALIDTTPQDALRSAGQLRRMDRRQDILPDYSGEFAPRVYSASAATPDQQEAEAFFQRYAELQRQTAPKRPLSAYLREKGGIDPSGNAARELRARGVTSRTHPALFRKGGMKELDNLVSEEFPIEAIRGQRDATGYADPEAIYDGLVEEGYGRAMLNPDQQALADELAAMEQMVPEYEARLSAAAMVPDDPGAVSDAMTPRTVRDVDMIKRALDDIARREQGAGLLGGNTAYGQAAQRRAREIRDALAEAVPEYREALAEGADAIQRVEAVRTGADLLKPSTTRAQVDEFVQNATPGELFAAKEGLRGQIDEVMANAKAAASDPFQDAREAAKIVKDMNSRAGREKIARLFGDDAGPILRALDEASASIGMRASVAANSRTNIRGNIQGDIADISGGGAVEAAARGEPIEGTKRIVQAITGYTDEFTAQQRQEIYRDLANALTRRGGKEAEQALRFIQSAMQKQNVTAEETEAIARIVAGALYGVGTPAATRSAAEEYR